MMQTFTLQLYVLAVFVSLTEGVRTTCRYEGKKFIVLVTSPDTIIAVAGPPNTTVDSYELLSGKEKQHVINDSMVTYLEPVFEDTDVEPLWKEMRFILITTSSHVNIFVHLSRGDGYTAVRSKHHVPYTYTIASYQPDINCETFIAVVSYNNDVTVNGTVRILNSNQAELEPGGKTLSNGESFGGNIEDKWDFLLMYSKGDLTGTHIQANQPIAVFSGSRCCATKFGSFCGSHRHTIQQVVPAKLHTYSQYLLHLSTANLAENLRAVWNNGTSTIVDDNLDVFNCGSEKCQVIQKLISYEPEKVFRQTTLNEIFRKKFHVVAFSGFSTTLYIIIRRWNWPFSGIESLKINNRAFEYKLHKELSPFGMILRVHVEPGVYIVTCEEFAFSLYAFGVGVNSAYSFAGGCISYSKEDELTTTGIEMTPTTLPVTVTEKYTTVTAPSEDNVTTPPEDSTTVTTPAEDNTIITTLSGDNTTVTTPSEDNVTTPPEDNNRVTIPSEDNTIITSLSKDNTTITTASEDNTTVATPSEENNTVTIASENNTIITTPSEDNIIVTKPYEDNTTVTTPSEDNTSVTTPSEDNTIVTTQSEDNTIVTTPSEESTSVTPSEDNTIVPTPSEDNTVVATPSEDNTSVTTSEDNTIVTTPSEEYTSVTTPSEDNTIVTTPSENSTIVTIPSEDNTIVTTPSEDNTSVTTSEDNTIVTTPSEESTSVTPSEDNTIVTTPSEDNTVVATPSEDNTSVTTSEDDTIVTTPSEEYTSVTTPSEDNTIVTTPSENSTIVTTPSEDNTIVTTPSEDNTSVTTSEDNTIVTTPSEDDITVTTLSADNTMGTKDDHGITSETTSETTKDKMFETNSTFTTQNPRISLPDKSTNPVRKFCPYKNGKVCDCSKKNHVNVQQTRLDPSGRLVTETFLDRNTVGAKRRRKISIAENRPSSRAIGLGSLVLMCIPFGFVLLLDLQRLLVQRLRK